MTALSTLEPRSLWKSFAELNAVPRPSKKEERVIAFIKEFGESLNLVVHIDHIGNVIIKKPATPGMEDRVTVVMQSHLDMVHQKNAATDFDFLTEGIRMFVEGDWVKAEGTTLGADNGIGVATIMAILASDDIPHPAIEALFTIDEETGMTGALELKGGLLEGKIMLNLDTEDDNELTIGCAGGIDITAKGHYAQTPLDENFAAYKLQVKGLSGGHSGMDIHKGLGNANKLMNRLLYSASKQYGARIAHIDGGGLRNAIPRESTAVLAIPTSHLIAFEQFVKRESIVLEREYATTDDALHIQLVATTCPDRVLAHDFQKNLIRAIYACPNGIARMSPDIADLVQTSNNLARVLVANGDYEILCLTRSSVDTEKMDLARAIGSTFQLIGATISMDGNYPGWTPQPKSAIVALMTRLYQDMFDEMPHVNACHAGLECGILGRNYPDMQMISFGPNIRGAHSPDERVQISSVQKFWSFTRATLAAIPNR